MKSPLHGCLALCLAWFATALPSRVAAQVGMVPESPIVVVVEAAGTRIDAARIRVLIEEQIESPVVSIIEAAGRTTLGTLAVAVTERGRHAAINYVPSDGTRFAVMIEVDATTPVDTFGEWLVAPCVAAIRTSSERRAASSGPVDVLDPWLASRAAMSGTHEVIDPWVGTPRRRVRVELVEYHLGDEIIDPWEEAVTSYREEQAQRLSRPRTARRGTPAARRRAPAARTPAPSRRTSP